MTVSLTEKGIAVDSKPLPGPNYSIQQLFSESVVTPSADIDPSAPAAARLESLVLPATTHYL